MIGFHSVYEVENGKPVETGFGNALYGAYLSKLGLSDRAIMYLSSAAPTSMNWLTPAQAESVGIELKVFDPKSQPAASTPVAKKDDTLEARARDFIIAVHVLVSGPTEKFLRVAPGLYSNQVLYYGKETTRSEIVSQIARFVDRWPVRTYTVQIGTLSAQCNIQEFQCRVSGLVDFDASSLARNKRSHGVASFEYELLFRSGDRWPLIISENGKVVTRRIDPLGEAKARVGDQAPLTVLPTH